MAMKTRLLVLPLTACLALAVSAAPALAHGKRAIVGKQVFVQAAAAYIGVTPAELKAAKRAGQTPAQLAVANGKTVAGLTNALIAAGTAKINAARTAGRITDAQAAAKLAVLPDRVEAFINSASGGEADCSHEDSSSSSSSSSLSRQRRG
jgi:hypothetical protein